MCLFGPSHEQTQKLTLKSSRIRVYANVVGLSKALSKAGLAGAEKRSLAPFIANFNRSYPLTDFVDAGEYKENADFKLRGLLRLYAENAQCKHLFFAACHDGGYVSELSPYRGQKERFTLIRTPGLYFHEEFTKLDLGIEELHGVFRPSGSAMDGPYPKPHQAFTPYNGNMNAKAAISAVTPPASATKQSEAAKPCHFYKTGKCRYGAQCINLHLDPQDSAMPVTSKLSRDSWRSEPGYDQNGFGSPASKSQSSALVPIDPRLLPTRAQVPDGHIAVNSDGYRLDPYVESISVDVEQRLKSRTAGQRLCNSLHLLGSCHNRNCEYDHHPLDAELRPALELLARSVPCPKRGACRNARCTHGHVCQKADCKFRGGKTYCKLGLPAHINNLTATRFVPAINAGSSSGSYASYGDGRLTVGPVTPDSPRTHSNGLADSSSRSGSLAGAERPKELHEKYPVMSYTDRSSVATEEDEVEDDEGNGAATCDRGAAIEPVSSSPSST